MKIDLLSDIDIDDSNNDEVVWQKARFVQKLHPSRHTDYEITDIDYLLIILARKEGDRALECFDRLLDPFEMYLMANTGLPSIVRVNMHCYCFEVGMIRVFEDTCAAFAEFSNWRNERELPHDWRERRQELESENELRKDLMSLLNERVMDYCSYFSKQIFEWKRKEALWRWKIVRKHVFKRMLVFYWFESSQKKYYEAMWQRDKSEFELDFFFKIVMLREFLGNQCSTYHLLL